MNRLATRWAITTIFVLSGAGTAFAGGTGGSTGDDTGDAETTAVATTDGSSSETTAGECDVCPPGTSAGDIEFSDLDHGRPPVGENVVQVSAASKCTCSDCMCHDEEATQIRLELDGEAVGEPCADSQCEFVVVLTPGSHELTAFASYGSGDVSASVELLVESEGGSSETGAPMETESDANGCGCASPRRTTDPLALLVISGALARRRRRRG